VTAQASELNLASWLKSYNPKLCASDTTPLVGAPLPFPWEKLSTALKTIFGLPQLEIIPQEISFQDNKKWLSDLGAHPLFFSLGASGVEGNFFALFSQDDFKTILQAVLGLDTASVSLLQQDFIESFNLFLIAQIVHEINSCTFAKVDFHLISQQEPQEESYLVQEFVIVFNEKRLVGKILLPKAFLDSWRAYTLKTFGEDLFKKRLQDLQLTISIEAARTSLSLEKLHTIKPGDFLLLDQLFYSPETKNPSCFLSIEGHLLFQGQVQDNKVKISQIPTQYEAL